MKARLTKLINHLPTHLAYFSLPGVCVLCNGASKRNIDLCVGCQRDLPRIHSPCFQCGLEHTGALDSCARCIARPPIFSHCLAAFQYQFPVDLLVSQLKNSGSLATGRVLSILLAHRFLNSRSPTPDLWVPVPLHPSVKKQRGFNQATELGRTLAKVTGKPILERGISRSKNTLSQKQLSGRQRQSNLSGAFNVEVDLSGLNIGVIDDVVTTGATAGALTQSLLAAGAKDVQILCFARTATK